MYRYFRHQPATELQGCSLAAAVLSNISTIMNNRHINDTKDTYKDMYKYLRHQPATELQGCLLAAAVLFVIYINNNE